ncbi:DUF6452 family protein [Chitinophaga niabensis]|uniref:DUF6452 family protein n=1 Tax=Chitinophaga niabensis TaxID=536979 RepID=UPI0031BAB2C3
MKYILLTACILTLLIACTDDTKLCDVDTRTEVRVRFRTKRPGFVEKDTTATNLILLAVGKDKIYDSAKTLRGMQFSLDRLSDQASFYFQPDADSVGKAATITFYYKRQPKFISAGCGVIMTYAIDSVKYINDTRAAIKVLIVNQHIVTTGNETNISITL